MLRGNQHDIVRTFGRADLLGQAFEEPVVMTRLVFQRLDPILSPEIVLAIGKIVNKAPVVRGRQKVAQENALI